MIHLMLLKPVTFTHSFPHCNSEGQQQLGRSHHFTAKKDLKMIGSSFRFSLKHELVGFVCQTCSYNDNALSSASNFLNKG